jgi:hypothetical protein
MQEIKKMQETQIMKGKKSNLACRRWGGAGLAASLAALRWRKKEQISAEEKASSRLELLVCLRKELLLRLLLEEEETRGQRGGGRSMFLGEKTMERKKKKGGCGAGLSSFTAGVRRMTDWEGLLCLGEKEQENGAGLREEENAGTGWRGREAEGKWPCVGEL